jgi:hypothetical protein
MSRALHLNHHARSYCGVDLDHWTGILFASNDVNGTPRRPHDFSYNTQEKRAQKGRTETKEKRGYRSFSSEGTVLKRWSLLKIKNTDRGNKNGFKITDISVWEDIRVQDDINTIISHQEHHNFNIYENGKKAKKLKLLLLCFLIMLKKNP